MATGFLTCTLGIFCEERGAWGFGTVGAFGVLLLPLTFVVPVLGWEEATGADEIGPFEAGATEDGTDFSCIGMLADAPAPFGRALCFARSANARFILVLLEEQISQGR